MEIYPRCIDVLWMDEIKPPRMTELDRISVFYILERLRVNCTWQHFCGGFACPARDSFLNGVSTRPARQPDWAISRYNSRIAGKSFERPGVASGRSAQPKRGACQVCRHSSAFDRFQDTGRHVRTHPTFSHARQRCQPSSPDFLRACCLKERVRQ